MCEREDGEEIEVYVKYRDFHDDLTFDFLTGELVANQYALDLGLPAAQPCLVDFSQEFLELLPDTQEGQEVWDAFQGMQATAFGSVAFPTIRRWKAGNLVRKNQLQVATNLYLFDTIVENTDRGVGNTNLLMLGYDFKVIDFGHSFQRCHEGSEIDGAQPWEPNGIYNHFQGNAQHALFSGLRNVTEAEISDFTTSLQNLSDEIIEDYVSIVPQEWGQDCACNIVDYLLDARAHAGEFHERAKEVLL